ncbi:MAG: hypothetical protein M3Q58_02130 [Bacteroidota bacterium]|nr:hypothetical protein [Bacteroidota bacterium]
MKKNQVLVIAIIFISVVFFKSCSNQNTEAFVKPPFQTLNVLFLSFIINVDEVNFIELPNGGSISIPANVFVDANKKPIVGKVDLKYREFQNVADLILSGIPMVYDSAGKKNIFESAGMFEILGYQNNNPVYIKENTSLTITTASDYKESNYSAYLLDTVNKNWNYLGIAEAQNNFKKDSLEAFISQIPVQPLQPKKINSQSKLIDLDVNYSRFSELKHFHGLMWEYAEDDAKANFDETIYKENWADIKIARCEGQDNFIITLKNSKREVDIKVAPILTGKSYDKAMEKYQDAFANFENELVKKEKAASLAVAQKQFLRTMEVNQFGIYNWDRIFKQEDLLAIDADFKFNEKTVFDPKEVLIYLMVSDKNAIVQYDASSWNKFSFSPDENNKLIAILPDDKIAVFSSKEFKKLNIDKLYGTPKHTFELVIKPSKILSSQHLFDELKNI